MRPGWFARFIGRARRNWQVKIGSLLVSLIVFAYVQYTRNITRTLNIRVEAPDIPANLVMSSRLPSFMNVEFYGPSEQLEINSSNFRIQLTSPSPSPGTNIYRAVLVPEPPPGIRASYDNEIRLTLDRNLKRILPVVPVLDLTQTTNTKIGYYEVQPATIELQGPHTVLSELDRVQTRPVVVKSDQSSYRVLLSNLPEFVNLMPQQPFEVEIQTRLLELTDRPGQNEYLVDGVKVRCRNNPGELRMEVLGKQQLQVKVLATRPVTAGQLNATVYCPAFFDDVSNTVKPSFMVQDLPVEIDDRLGRPDFEVVEVTPMHITVQFERIVARQRTEIEQGLEEHLMRQP